MPAQKKRMVLCRCGHHKTIHKYDPKDEGRKGPAQCRNCDCKRFMTRGDEKLLLLGERYGMSTPRVLKPKEGLIFSEVDYSSLELRAMAEAAKQEKERREDGDDSED